jgi:hypothetical protein
MHHSSIPEMVMATGSIAPVSPYQARQDISEAHVAYVTRVPVGLQPGEAQYSPPPSAFSVSSAADPSRTMLPDGSVSLAGFEDEIYMLGDFGLSWSDPAVQLYVYGTLGLAIVGAAAGALCSKPGRRARTAGKFALIGAGGGAVTAALVNFARK